MPASGFSHSCYREENRGEQGRVRSRGRALRWLWNGRKGEGIEEGKLCCVVLRSVNGLMGKRKGCRFWWLIGGWLLVNPHKTNIPPLRLLPFPSTQTMPPHPKLPFLFYKRFFFSFFFFLFNIYIQISDFFFFLISFENFLIGIHTF